MADTPGSSAAPTTFVYPESFQRALDNRLTSSQLDALLSSSKPIFVYGTLMLPTTVARIIYDRERNASHRDAMAIADKMTPAILNKHERLAVRGAAFPAIVPSTSLEHTVTGLVILGLTPEQRGYIDWYEAGLYNLENAKVEVNVKPDGKMTIDADVYVWKSGRDDLCEPTDAQWSIEEYIGTSFFGS